MKVHLPLDFVIGDDFSDTANTEVATDETGIKAGWEGFDCAEKTRTRNDGVIRAAKTVVWNGPLGVFELAPFQGGTKAGIESLVEATKEGATTIIGGGDTATAAKVFGVEDRSATSAPGAVRA